MGVKEANDLLRNVWADLQRSAQRHELEAIKANPAKHRLTRLMAEGAHTGYTFFRAEDMKTTRIRYCVSTHRNAANVFLIWRQADIFSGRGRKRKWKQAKRTDFRWAATKKEAFEIARKLAEKSKLDYAHKRAAQLPNAPAEACTMLAKAID